MGSPKAMVDRIKKIAAERPKIVERGLYTEGQIEMTEAKKRTPVSPLPAPKGVVPGTLRASGTVHFPERKGNRITVTLSFGGAASDYAIVQHENPDFFHTTGQWKYLESVLNESAPYMLGRLARRVHLERSR
jgi:hypothetical protein